MSGIELKQWLKCSTYSPEELCVILEVSIGTLYNWFRSKQIDNRTLLALAQLGCPVAQKEVEAQPSKSTGFGR